MALTDTGTGSRERTLTLRFITPFVNENFYGTVKKGMADAARLFGAECTFVGTEELDLAEQMRLMDEAEGEAVDGIALNILDPTALNDAIARTMRGGVPVVAFNVDASKGAAGHLSFVQQDLYGAGRVMGARAEPNLAPGARVLITVHSAGVSALEDRVRGMQEMIRVKEVTWDVLTAGNTPVLAEATIADALRADPSIDAVLSTGQADTEGAGLAAVGEFRGRGLYVAGFDLSPQVLDLIRKGVIDFTVDQQPYLQGFMPVLQLVFYLRYGIRPCNIDAGATIIDRSNVDAVIELTKDGYR